MRHAWKASLVAAVVVTSGCRDKAVRLKPEVDWALKQGDAATAFEKIEKIKSWHTPTFEELAPRVLYYDTLAQIEANIASGKMPPGDVEKVVGALADPDVSAWWKSRGPVLRKWATAKETPRLEVVFTWSDGSPMISVEPKT